MTAPPTPAPPTAAPAESDHTAVPSSPSTLARAWLADPARPVLCEPGDRFRAAAELLAAVREARPDVRLVVVVEDDDHAAEWEAGLAAVTAAATAGGVVSTTAAGTGPPPPPPRVCRATDLDRHVAGRPDELVVIDRVRRRFPLPRPRAAEWRAVLTDDPAAHRPGTVPLPVQEVARWLAAMLAPAQRGDGYAPRVLEVAPLLGVHPREVRSSVQTLTPTGAIFLATALASHLVPGIPVRSSSGEEAPQLQRLDLGDDDAMVFVDVLCRVRIEDDEAIVLLWRQNPITFLVETYATSVAAVQRVSRALLERGRGPLNPFRGRVVEVGALDDHPQLTGLPRPAAARADLDVPAELWDEIDTNIHGLFAKRRVLSDLGFDCNRGVLLTGPPGTGKTHLCRIVASEVAPGTTVMVVQTEAAARVLAGVYVLAELLAPTLVIIEDIDLVIGIGRGRPGALHDFLVSVDGLMTAHDGVVTLATTNHPQALDAAVRRAARFDRILEVGPPPPRGREQILRSHLGRLGTGLVAGIDVVRVAAAADGATGADLREIVRHAVLLSPDGALTTDVLLRAAAARGLVTVPATAYL
jgi:cell division protease FtsH